MMNLSVSKDVKKALVLASLIVVAGAASADGGGSSVTLDLSPINDALKLVTQVGSMSFLVYVAIKGYQWVRSALR